MKNNNQNAKNGLILVWSFQSFIAAWCHVVSSDSQFSGSTPCSKLRYFHLLIPFKRKSVDIFKLFLDFCPSSVLIQEPPEDFRAWGDPHCATEGLGLVLARVYRFGNQRHEKLWLSWIWLFLLRQAGLSAGVEVYIACAFSTGKMFLHSSASLCSLEFHFRATFVALTWQASLYLEQKPSCLAACIDLESYSGWAN